MSALETVKTLEVAAGVVYRADGTVLIARRDESLHQGGLWEFPGGKIEPGETPEQALVRELKEELDIAVADAAPLITIRHRYPDRSVVLRVFGVTRFSGTPKGMQGQPVRWVEPDRLGDYDFPAANRPIVSAARLPPYYAILDDQVSEDLTGDLQKLLANGILLIQARLKTSSEAKRRSFLSAAYALCSERGAVLLLNSAAGLEASPLHGLHLTARDLLALNARPPNCAWIGASCHNPLELAHAEAIGADFAVLAPVLPTQTHPDASGLGWNRFAEWVDAAKIPVYALGGLAKNDLPHARLAGAQGIAGIRTFLE